MKTLIVPKNYNEKKLNTFLFDNFNGLTNNTLHKTLRKKDIKINNIRVSENKTIYEGDEIKIYIVDDLLYKSEEIEKIYEDSNIVVFNKPINIEVIGENSLETYAQKLYQNEYVKPCHRLDRNTTGLVLFAKNKIALNILLEKFKNHQITKKYKCIVVGIPKIENQTIESYLFKDNKKSLVYISDVAKKGYRKIITTYKVIKKDYEKNIAILDVILHTGRTHQIRAHLAHIGHPILGDGKYGVNEINKKFKIKNQQLCSYCIQFDFNNDNNELSYLNNKTIQLNNLPFNIL